MCKYHLAFCGSSLLFLDGIICSTKGLNFYEVQRLFAPSAARGSGVVFEKPLPGSGSCEFAPVFSSESFIVVASKFRSVLHLKLIFVYEVTKGFSFIL